MPLTACASVGLSIAAYTLSRPCFPGNGGGEIAGLVDEAPGGSIEWVTPAVGAGDVAHAVVTSTMMLPPTNVLRSLANALEGCFTPVIPMATMGRPRIPSPDVDRPGTVATVP